MTLREWQDKWDYIIGTSQTGAMFVTNDLVCGARSELFHLSDYAVSSVVAGTIWLVKGDAHDRPPQ